MNTTWTLTKYFMSPWQLAFIGVYFIFFLVSNDNRRTTCDSFGIYGILRFSSIQFGKARVVGYFPCFFGCLFLMLGSLPDQRR